MNANDLLDMIGDAKGEYIWQAQQHRTGEAAPKRKRLSVRKALLIAAIVALMLLLVGCTVVYVLRLQDMKIGEYTAVEPEHYGPNWEKVEATEITHDLLSLQGPNQLAIAEWLEFRENYDTDRRLLAANNHNEAGLPDTYLTFGCYTWEMVQKVDEIAEKYGLELLGPSLVFQPGQYQILFDTFNLPDICHGADAETEYISGYFYKAGSFHLAMDITLTGGDAAWPYPVSMDMRYSVKGYFDPVYRSVRDIDSFHQWNHTLPDGTVVLLAMDDTSAMILVDRTDAFITVSFASKRGVDSMTKETVEQITDLFDFSIQPHSLSESEWAEAQAQLDALNEQALQASQERQAEYAQSLYKEDFEDWVKQTLETSNDPAALGYAFLDIDGNGTEELLIGRDGYATAIYIERDGTTELLNNAYFYMYPCQDHKLAGVMGFGEEAEYFLCVCSNGTAKTEAHIRYVPGCPDGEYWRYDLTAWNQYDYISKEEFDSILNAYVRIPVTFLPLTEYPLDEEVTLPAEHSFVFEEPYETYAEKVRVRLTDMEEHWGRWAYDLHDLDGNGQDEMIWREDDRYFVYTVLDGQVCAYRFLGDNVTVCGNGFVEAVSNYGPVNKTYHYYRIDGDCATLVEYLRYDVDVNPDNPWFRSTDASGQDISMVPISQAEFDAIRAKYTPMELNMKPIAEFPLD